MNCGQKTSFLGCVAMANGWGMWLENKSFQVVAFLVVYVARQKAVICI